MNSHPSATRASLILRLGDHEDVAAWEEFTKIYQPVIQRVATKQGLQNADAENLVQEVFLAVAHSVEDWVQREDRGRFRPWLIRIARNAAVDMMTRRATRPLGRDGESGARLLAELPSPEALSQALETEYAQQVYRWAAAEVQNSVEPKTWQAFHLTQVERRPVKEVAEQTGMRPANLYIARSRVMSRIKSLVAQYENYQQQETQ